LYNRYLNITENKKEIAKTGARILIIVIDDPLKCQ